MTGNISKSKGFKGDKGDIPVISFQHDVDTGKLYCYADGKLVGETHILSESFATKIGVAEEINKISGDLVIDIEQSVIFFKDLLVYDKNGNPTTNIDDVHAGIFRMVEAESNDDIEQAMPCLLVQNKNVIRNKKDSSVEYIVRQEILMGDGVTRYRMIADLSNRPVFTDYIIEPYDYLDDLGLSTQPLSAKQGYVLEQKKADKTEVDDKLSKKENISNKAIVVDGSANDTTYPSTKAVKEYVGVVSAEIIQHAANALKGRASGNPVILSDVSPIEHDITVTGDIGSVYITRTGKNHFNGNLVLGAWVYSTGNYTSSTDGYVTCAKKIPIIGGKKYTLSFASDKGNMHGVVFFAHDGSFISGDSSVRTNPFTFVAPAEAKYMCFNLYYSKGLNAKDVKTVQLEFGGNATEYEPYVEPIEYFSDGEEPIKITSLYPTTVLYSSTSVTIETEYNKDINVAIAETVEEYIQKTRRITTLSLYASKWQGSDGMYSQTVTIDNVTPYSKIDLQPTAEQLHIFHEKDIAFVVENDNGIITVYCIGQKPTNDYTMQATITEVKADE